MEEIKKRKPMSPIFSKRLSMAKFKLNREIFKQAAGLAKYKGVSVFSLLNDYLLISVVSASGDIVRGLGSEEWTRYCEVAWNELNRIEKPLPRFKKRNLPQPSQEAQKQI